MKSINHAINGLAASLLLNVGLTSAAEKFDASNAKDVVKVQNAVSSDFCVIACNFSPETGK